jgi:hypothetical protein
MSKYNYPVKKINSFLPDIPINEESRDKLFSLAISHDLSGLEEFITTNSISLNVRNNNNQTIIHVLLDSENTTDEKELLRCITFLVDRGVYISSSDKFLLTPLFICIKKNYFDIFKYLLEKGANTNINTYDNITVMHELAKSEHITYDANGIQSIIPEKLPKFDMEKYNVIKTKIDNVLFLNPIFKELKNIAAQFYYDDEKEDFNNKLLINEYKINLYNEKKTDIFEKIKSKLDIFYSSEIIEEIKKEELLQKLNTIKQELIDETKKTIMQDLNNQVLNAIKSMAYSLQLRNHFFFVDNIGLSHIATYQIINKINYSRTRIHNICDILDQNNVMRTIIKITKAVLVAIKEHKSINEDLVIKIKNIINIFVFFELDYNYTINLNILYLLNKINTNTVNYIDQLNKIKKDELYNEVYNLLTELNTGYLSPIVEEISNNVNNLINPINRNRILPLTNDLDIIDYIIKIFINVNNIKEDIDNLPDTFRTNIILINTYRSDGKSVYIAASLISVYFYIDYYITTRHKNLIPHIPCIKALLQTTILSAIPEKELTEIQEKLKDPILAIEVVIEAVLQIMFNIYNINNPIIDITVLKNTIKNTIKNVDDFVLSHIAVDIAMYIVEYINDIDNIDNIINIFENKENIREIIEIIEVAKKYNVINEKIISKKLADFYFVNGETFEDIIKGLDNNLYKTSEEIIELIDNILNEVNNNFNNKYNKIYTIHNILVSLSDKNSEIINNTKEIIDLLSNIKTNSNNIKNNIDNTQLNFKDETETVISTAIQSTIYAAVDIRIQHIIKNDTIRYIRGIDDIPIFLQEEVNKVLIPAIQTAIHTIVLSTIPSDRQLIHQEQLKNPIVAVEVKLATLKYISNFIAFFIPSILNIPKDIVIFKEAIKKAIKLPQIIPEILKNQDYNELIKSYKLINIPQQYLMLDNNNITNKDKSLETIIKKLTQANGILNNYKIIDNNTIILPVLKNIVLPDNNIIHHINFFNLLYTFNEYAKNNYNPKLLNDNIFLLYQNIQQIYKYNYIIYIFEKQKNTILQLKEHYDNNYTELKNKIDDVFDKNFKELENSINNIKEKLKKIEELSNQYIDIYNKRNGLDIFLNLENNMKLKNININMFIGIYPKIKFPTINDIKYTLNTENAKILECSYDYIKYNEHKNDFFHNFVLYFQDIGILNNSVHPYIEKRNYFLNSIPFNYNQDIINNNKQDIDNNNNIFKLFKLFFYDPIYLKLAKQNIINNLLNLPEIKNIKTINNKILNKTVSNEFNEKIKTDILNKIFENQFDTMLINEIENLFKQEMSINSDKIEYDLSIKEPDFNTILLQSFGFKHILIPNYEFKNNKFLSISKNKFLECVLYFDTHYFKPCNISILEYYKENKFIKEILKNQQSLLLKTDIKGWTPIYYAIDSNNLNVIKTIIENKNRLIHYDNKHISPLQLCINKQLHHLNYLLDDKDDKDNIHYLNNYIKMLRNELKSNDILIPLNIDAVFIIALFIQNDIWCFNNIELFIFNKINKIKLNNSRRKQFDDEYNNAKKSDVEYFIFKFNDDDVKYNNRTEIKYEKYNNEEYNYNDHDRDRDLNEIFLKYYKKAKKLEKQDFGLYGSYWINYNKFSDETKEILDHINISKNFKKILEKLKQIEQKKNIFNVLLPGYDKDQIKKQINLLTPIKIKLEHYLKFINIRFNSNKDNAYTVFLNKIYVHVLANIIGVDFYLTMEELIIKYYIGKGTTIDTKEKNDNIKKQLLVLNKYLINNKLEEDNNFNYLYINQINQQKNPELVFKGVIIEILKKVLLEVNNNELINTYESIILPRYRDLYKITYKYLKMFIENYHKFIYNQYHGLNILISLLDNISS